MNIERDYRLWIYYSLSLSGAQARSFTILLIYFGNLLWFIESIDATFNTLHTRSTKLYISQGVCIGWTSIQFYQQEKDTMNQFIRISIAQN